VTNNSDQYDFFVSHARSDNSADLITRFVDELLVEYEQFAASRKLTFFIDNNEIYTGAVWQCRS
jgi:hypothetical protein